MLTMEEEVFESENHLNDMPQVPCFTVPCATKWIGFEDTQI